MEIPKKKVINTGFYKNKEGFRQAFRRFFDNIGILKEELEVVLTLNFRLCNSQVFLFDYNMPTATIATTVKKITAICILFCV